MHVSQGIKNRIFMSSTVPQRKYFLVHHCLLNISAMRMSSIFHPLQRLSSKTVYKSGILSLQSPKWEYNCSLGNWRASTWTQENHNTLPFELYSSSQSSTGWTNERNDRSLLPPGWLKFMRSLIQWFPAMTSYRQQGLSMQPSYNEFIQVSSILPVT